MNTARATICNNKGLHARAAAKLVKTASSYNAKIQVTRLPRDSEDTTPTSAGATSILSLLMLSAERGCAIELNGEGEQAAEAIAAIVALVERKFDEEE